MDENIIIKEYIDKTKKETYKLSFNSVKTNIMDDKIGGIPYLPIGNSYPVDKNCNKMGLLMQINLENFDLENFPKQGILEIFMSTSDDIFKLDFKDNYSVELYNQGLDYQKDIEEVKLPFLNQSCTISKERTSIARSYNNEDGCIKVLEKIIENNASDKKPLDFEEEIDNITSSIGCHIGGYSNIGYYENGSENISNEDECLLYIETAEEFFSNIGSVYAICITIDKDDLKNQNFNKAKINILYD